MNTLGSVMDIVEKARIFATAAHAAVKQTRKYTGEPYIVHPEHVVNIVETVIHTPEMLAAAWLHDVVEDTGVTMTDILCEFGSTDIANYVYWLTDTSTPKDGNRAQRKAKDRERLAQAPAEVQTIKLADLISNSHSIMKHDPKFAVIYLEEKRLLLEVLTQGDRMLWEMANEIISTYKQEQK
jgi:(p)ppGpp synthase/HD superfamily hydrolase